MAPPRLRLPVTRISWIVFFAGAGLLAVSGWSLYYGFVSDFWPRAQAVITRSQTRAVGRGVYLDLQYQFDCDRHTCTGDRWRFKLFANQSGFSSYADRPETVAASYPVGTHVEIAVSPGNLTDSVLEPGMSTSDVGLALVGGLLMLSACIPEFFNRGRNKRHRFAAASAGPTASAAKLTQPEKLRARIKLALTIGGLSLLAISTFPSLHKWTASTWPTVQGNVLYKRMIPGITSKGIVQYAYVVDGKRLLGQGYDAGSQEWIRAWLRSLPDGGPVTVHYNPRDPSESQVVLAARPRHWIIPGFSVLIILLGLGMRSKMPSAQPH